jgi:DinB family protein
MRSAEIETYASELSWILDQICRSLDGLSEAQLGSRPLLTGNSPYTIANHTIEATRVYALGLGCGNSVSRNREAEFDSPTTSVAEITARLRDLAGQLRNELSALAPEMLGERLIPAREIWGTGPIHEISRREALVESVRHAALHLGELRLTRDLIAG